MKNEAGIILKLASSLKRKDEEPNKALALEIVRNHDRAAVAELVANLANTKAIQNDCIKVLYEIGDHEPALIAPYSTAFLTHLNSKNNRLQWGAMTALSSITSHIPEEVYAHLPAILNAADKGSVITKDRAVAILIQLCAIEAYSKSAFSLLMEQLLKSAPNQLPMYAERAMPIITAHTKDRFVQVLSSRLDDLQQASKRKRVEKVVAKYVD